MIFVLFPRYFSTMAYSADGETLLAAGKSKNVCIYHIATGILLKKLEITQNHSLDGLDVSKHSHNFQNQRPSIEILSFVLTVFFIPIK